MIIGFGVGGLLMMEMQVYVLEGKGFGWVSLFMVLMMIFNMVIGLVVIVLGIKGFSFVVVIVCVVGFNVVGDVFWLLQLGKVDVMVCGGVELVIIFLGVVGFVSVKVLFFCNDDLVIVSCLFDKECDGFVIGEGVGVLVFEIFEYVQVCGVMIFGEVVGYGMICDVYYIIFLIFGGVGGVEVMCLVLVDGVIDLLEIDYVNVYGISILVNDKNEILVIKSVLGECVLQILVSFIKLMIGYLLGGFGGIEVVVCVLVL